MMCPVRMWGRLLTWYWLAITQCCTCFTSSGTHNAFDSNATRLSPLASAHVAPQCRVAWSATRCQLLRADWRAFGVCFDQIRALIGVSELGLQAPARPAPRASGSVAAVSPARPRHIRRAALRALLRKRPTDGRTLPRKGRAERSSGRRRCLLPPTCARVVGLPRFAHTMFARVSTVAPSPPRTSRYRRHLQPPSLQSHCPGHPPIHPTIQPRHTLRSHPKARIQLVYRRPTTPSSGECSRSPRA